MLVRDLPPGERPMDRLARIGPQALTDKELLAVILGGQTALEAAAIALQDGLGRLQNRSRNPLLSEIRQARIVALLELCRRLDAVQAKPQRVILRAEDIARHLVARYSHEPQERVGVVLLDARRRYIAEREVYVGQQDHVSGGPRWILKHALVEDAAAIVVFHNHPSGDPSPSVEDSKSTEHLKTVCEAIGVELFDHIIVGRKTYYSYREKRRLGKRNS
jgi:DNA repair protein RadC